MRSGRKHLYGFQRQKYKASAKVWVLAAGYEDDRREGPPLLLRKGFIHSRVQWS